MTVPEHVASARAAYDVVAEDYATVLSGLLAAQPVDRSVLALFAERVLTGTVDVGPHRPVGDLGCGPGRLTGHLVGLGLPVIGVDVSPGMLAVARRAHPDVPFTLGALTSLGLADGALGAVLAWYSVIHTPPEHLPAVFAEFARVLAPGGQIVLAFQVGDVRHHISHGYGHDVSLDAWRSRPEDVERGLGDAGFTMDVRVVRAAEPTETTPQAYLLGRLDPAG